jgi:hypothetical protein
MTRIAVFMQGRRERVAVKRILKAVRNPEPYLL